MRSEIISGISALKEKDKYFIGGKKI